ncbi:MAG TPA: aminoacyl-tRNA hydrolase [Gammaproteobacteria bacterium]|jgi:PTH1 family peptidyl-tRNA hydrolase|nr:aminoacyl-tRNA hydrolase [Gammaproteobacteria bacterium]
MRSANIIPKIFIGLGNPGDRYQNTRHNLGYLSIDCFMERHQLEGLKDDKKSGGSLLKSELFDQEFLLFKSSRYMNESGLSINRLRKYRNISMQDICIIHDDLDLNVGEVRVKYSGGHGGHNGLRNIIQACGANDFIRIRMGIGHPEKDQVIDYVLSKPKKDEKEVLDQSVYEAADAMDSLLQNGLDETMNQFN